MLEFISSTANGDAKLNGREGASTSDHFVPTSMTPETPTSDSPPENTIRPISRVAESRHSAWLAAQQRAHFLILPDTWFERLWDVIVSIVSLVSGTLPPHVQPPLPLVHPPPGGRGGTVTG